MSTRADELARGVSSIFHGSKPKRVEKGWWRHFAEALINEQAENLPPLRMLKGMVENNAEEFFVKGIPPVQAARGLAKKAKATAKLDIREDETGTEDLVGGIAGTASYLGTGPNAALPALARKAKVPISRAIAAERKLTDKLKEKVPVLGRKIELDTSSVANANLPKFKLTDDAGNARKFAKSEKLIEESGGTNIKIDSKGKVTWKDKEGNKRSADLTQRFGPRQLRTNPRALGENPRAEDLDSIESGDLDNIETLKGDKDDIVSRVSEASGISRERMAELTKSGKSWSAKKKAIEKFDDEVDEWDDDIDDAVEMRAPKPKMSSRNIDNDLPTFTGRHAADTGGTSVEEIHRQGSFYKIGKNGEPTYLSKAVDAGNLKPDEAIIHVVKGREPVIYQGSGPKEALLRFKKTRTGSEFYKHEVGAGAKPKAGRKRQTLTATQIPTIDASRYGKHVTDRINGRKINFASDFDKVAYALASGKIPNRKILNHVMKLTNFDEDTILQHGIRIKNSVNKGLAGGGRKAITLHPRSIQVIGTPADVSLRRQLWGLPSEFKFAGDLPALRQSFRPVVTHPFKTGLPAFKRALGAMTEKGYREQIENFPDELAVYDILDTAKAVGPTKAKRLYPHIKELEKLGGTKHDVYDYFSSGTLGERIPVAGELPKISKRMFDVFQRSVRGTEVQRTADLLGKSVEQLAKEGHSELPSLLRSVNERTGFGPLGKLEPTGEEIAYWFNAPRNTMAKAQFYNPLNYLPESALPKFITDKGLGGRYGKDFKSPILHDIWKDTAKIGGGLGALKLASDATGIGEVDLNPRSSVMGANFDNWRPDIFGGEKGIPQTIGKMLDPQGGVNAKGDEYDVDPSEEFFKFMRYRLKPGIPSMLGDLLLGYNRDTQTRENAIGEDIALPFDEESPIHNVPGVNKLAEQPYSRWMANQFTTSWPEDVYDAYTGAGPTQGVLAAILGGAGMGSSTFDPYNPYQPYRAENRFIRIPKREKKGNRESIMPGGLR